MEKRTLSYAYRISRWAYAKYVQLIALRLFFFKKSKGPCVFFAGAKSGSSGGAAVKVLRLKKNLMKVILTSILFTIKQLCFFR